MPTLQRKCVDWYNAECSFEVPRYAIPGIYGKTLPFAYESYRSSVRVAAFIVLFLLLSCLVVSVSHGQLSPAQRVSVLDTQ